MSQNYELIRKTGKGQALFATSAPSTIEPDTDTTVATVDPGMTVLDKEVPPADCGSSVDKTAVVQNTSPAFPISEGKGTLFDEPVSGVARGCRKFGSELRAFVKAIVTPEIPANTEAIAREELSKLVHRLFLARAQPPKVVVFASLDRGDGCSRVCSDTARTLAAQTAASVCIVDADLTCPAMGRIFALDKDAGFPETTFQMPGVREYSHHIGEDGNLWVTTGEVLASENRSLLPLEPLSVRMHELRETYDFVLIDAPPLSSCVAAARLGALADGVILVLAANRTKRDSAARAKRDLEAANCRLLTAVLNRRTFPVPEPIYTRI